MIIDEIPSIEIVDVRSPESQLFAWLRGHGKTLIENGDAEFGTALVACAELAQKAHEDRDALLDAAIAVLKPFDETAPKPTRENPVLDLGPALAGLNGLAEVVNRLCAPLKPNQIDPDSPDEVPGTPDPKA